MDSNINSINNELNGNQNQLIDENSINNNNNNEINLDSINTKKVKLDSNEVQSKPEQNQRQQQSNQSNQVKSRVVHVRNIPMDSTENDLISIAMSFGRVTNCLILRGKSQAFIEFMSSESAQQMINYWLQTTVAGVATQLQPTIRGRHVFC
jgi:RNA recognition motif-containing protein